MFNPRNNIDNSSSSNTYYVEINIKHFSRTYSLRNSESTSENQWRDVKVGDFKRDKHSH